MPDEIQVYDKERLREMTMLGMTNVDPKDIHPAQILLIQKTSSFDSFVTEDGKKPVAGDYFNTGTFTILPEFECHFVYAEKSKYKVEKDGKKYDADQYKAICVLPDMSLGQVVFRSTALYTLSKLFSLAVSQQRPIFTFKILMSKEIRKGEKKTENGVKMVEWLVPVCTIVGKEDDSELITKLKGISLQFERKVTVRRAVTPEVESLPSGEADKEPTKEELENPAETVEAAEIPF